MSSTPSRRLLHAGAFIVLGASGAFAQPYGYPGAPVPTGPGVVYAPSYGPGPRPYWNDMYGSPYEGRSAAEYQYDRSGTIGRLDLGADPRHPEGPGNPRIGGFR